MKPFRKHSEDVRLLIRILIWTPISVLTMLLLLCVTPIRACFREGFTNLPVSFIGADLQYMGAGLVIAIIYTIIGVAISTFFQVNSTKWWRYVSILYVVYVILIIIGLKVYMGGDFSQFVVLFLDVLLGPILFLGELEIAHLIRNRRKAKQIQPEQSRG